MTRRPWFSRLAAMAVAVASLGFASTAVAQSIAGWPQYQGGPTHPGVATGPEPGFASAWELPVAPGGPGDRFGLSAPVISGGTVIAVGPQEVLGVDVSTGEEAWSWPREVGPSVPGAIAETDDGSVFVYTEGWGDGPPPASGIAPSATTPPSPSPAVDAADAETFEGPSRLVALSISGSPIELWKLDLPEVSRTGVLVTGSLAIVGTNDGAVTAVDVATGEVAWTAQAGRAMDVTPASDGETVVIPVLGGDTSGVTVLALSVADGSERWRFAPESTALLATPPAIADGVVYVGYADRAMFAVDLATGQQRWRLVLNGAPVYSPPVPTPGAVYVIDVGAYGSQLHALDPVTGERLWDHPLDEPVLRVPPLALGGAVVTGSIEGDVVAFDASSGDETFRTAGSGPVRSVASDGSTLVVVRGASAAGLQAYVHDEDAPLTSIASPTEPDPLMLVGAWAAASVVTIGVVLVLGRALDRRLGPPVFADAGLDLDPMDDAADDSDAEDPR